MTHRPSVVGKCPSSTWVNGSGSIIIDVVSNTGTLNVRIIKKDGASISAIGPSTVAGSIFTFNNLGPGKYIIRYRINDGCNRTIYDTVTIKPYQYPNLSRSTAYQCDLNGFSIGAVVAEGVGPFSYEIIGSTPASPSVITAPQSSPIFNINNGTNYSLIRLRALDACGNASLEDASILPLADNGIVSTYNCFQIYTTLSVDTLYNSSYRWYLKHSVDGTDSTYLGSDFSLHLPEVTPADTGLYVCHLSVNSGCINRTYYYHLDGYCSHYLPVVLENFAGRYAGNKVLLDWKMAAGTAVNKFIVEKKGHDNAFSSMGTVNAAAGATASAYQFVDPSPFTTKNEYRLKMLGSNNAFAYSNVVSLQKQAATGISVYPNPVHNVLSVDFSKLPTNQVYKVKLVNLMNQVVKEVNHNTANGNKLTITRTKEISAGVYVVKLFNIATGEEYAEKVILQ